MPDVLIVQGSFNAMTAAALAMAAGGPFAFLLAYVLRRRPRSAVGRLALAGFTLPRGSPRPEPPKSGTGSK